MKVSPQQLLGKWFGGKTTFDAPQLSKLQLALGVLLAGQGLAILLLSGVYEVPIYLWHLTSDTLQSKLSGSPVFAPAIHEVVRLNIAYPLAKILFVTAVVYILMGTIWQKRYADWIKRRSYPARWALLALISADVLVTLGVLAGVRDVWTLLLIVTLQLVACASAAALELLHQRPGRVTPSAWLVLAIGLVAALVPWLVILGVLITTNLFGTTAVPAATWWLYGTTFAGWLLITVNAHLAHLRHGKWAHYAYAEFWYLVALFVVETAFAWQVFAAVLHP